MNMIENDVFTAVADKLRSELGAENIFITGEYTPTPPKFPCAFVYESDNYNAGYDSCRSEVMTGVAYEVQVFTNKQNGKKNEAKEIMRIIDSVLTPLGLKRIMLNQIPNIADASIFRMTARYTAAVIDNVIYRR